MKKIKKIYQRLILTCLTLCVLTACVQDDFNMPGDVVEGKPITVSLNFSAVPETDVVVTRADNSNSDLSRVAIFIYSGDHFQKLVRTADESLTIERNTANEDGVYYKATFETTSGTKKLLAVANTSTDDMAGAYWDNISAIARQAISGELTFEELKASVISLRDELIANGEMQPIQITSSDQMLMSGWNEEVVFDTKGNVTYKGNNVGGKDVILRLDRSLARITFRIPYKEFSYEDNAVNKIFTPTSYKVYNVPVNSYLGNIKEISGQEFKFTNYAESNVGSVEDGFYSFEFYMPENIYPEANGVTGYHDRDKWNYEGNEGATPEEKTNKNLWAHAPQYSTFVVIKGNYEETRTDKEYTGTVEYTIHLGDFSDTTGSWGNYSVERNCNYTYTVTVLNVENIVVEATKEDTSEYQEGSEGSIYDYTQSDYAYHLDAHYEQVYLQYNLSEIAEEVERNEDYRAGNITLDQAIADALVLTIQSEAMDDDHLETESEPYSVHNKRGTLRPYQIYVDNKVTKEKVLDGHFDYKWVEFWPQSETTIAKYPGVSDWSKDETDDLFNKGIYGGQAQGNNEYLMDVYDVIVAMGKVIKVIIENEGKRSSEQTEITTGSRNDDGIIVTNTNSNSYYGDPNYVARFTAFVNEYYYYHHPLTGEKIKMWSLFTNKMPREMIVALSTDISNDGNSTYSVLYSYISQLSIQTFYNSRVSSINGFGIETYNETPPYTFHRRTNNGLYTDNTFPNRDDYRGRNNQLIMLGMNDGGTPNWSDYISYRSNGWTRSVTSSRSDHELTDDAYSEEYAYSACMSRNRDLNGNGKIDKNEVRWYLPSLNEYIRISIGSYAISNAAQLYMGDKEELEKKTNDPQVYPIRYIDDGALYYTSSADKKRVYWAVERGSYGNVGNDWSAESDEYHQAKPIRCIRLLPKNNDDKIDISTTETESESTYDWNSNNRTLTFSGRLVESLYRQRVTRLDKHDEDDAANSFYQKIVVAKENVYTYEWQPGQGPWDDGEWVKRPDTTFPLGQIIRADGFSDVNPCANYHEDGDGGATWRVPNLVEFSAMRAVNEIDAETACCTQFSQQDVRLGFIYSGGNITCPGNTETLNNQYKVRCVRDVD